MTIKVITQTILSDLQTPVSIYLKVRDAFPQSALLESSDFHSNENSFSFIGVSPLARFEAKDGLVKTVLPGGETATLRIGADGRTLPRIFNDFAQAFTVAEGHNPTGINGFLGYTGYDAVRYFEDINPGERRDTATDIPEMLYILYRFLIVVDHFHDKMTIVESCIDGAPSRMDNLLAVLNNRNYASYNFSLRGAETSTITDEAYRQMVRRGVAHCERGDVFQLVLSRRFAQPFAGDDFKVYRALRTINPSPYLFYFDFGSFRIFGSSPETHCKIAGGKACIDPIAGTIRRSGSDEEDRQLANRLLADPKENAEHVMLVDLARNDLSKNTTDVHVEFYKEVQYYSHVIHLVSRVVGAVPAGTNPLKVFADTFPAGTLSGAPKVRAMQLIADLEPHNRGAYGGCIGYVGLNGDLNQAITIRSFISRSNVLYYQAGAGIVARSRDEGELQEVNSKLGALKKAIDAATQIIN